jgi:Asp-tRNA(Asn)/Glu-tRNA(Gln) amidotransferase A subunit family amidase
MIGPDLETCRARVRKLEGRVCAFAHVRELAPLASGPLDGVPFAAKDIFDTRDLPTEYGSPLCAGRRPVRDAALVRRLREMGAVLMGKTHTTAFAYFDPAPTRNPRNTGHTPGGSSSGSAAAVAAGMVAFALGSQTQGSVLRPASFCGVAGFKPTHGLLDLTGVMPFAPTLDTAGLFTATAAQMLELWRCMGLANKGSPNARMVAFPLPDGLHPRMKAAFARTCRSLGWKTVASPMPMSPLLTAVRTINDYEGARTLRRRLSDLQGTKLGELIQRGLRLTKRDYNDALSLLQEARNAMNNFYGKSRVAAWPAALGPAPRTLTSTGDPAMNAPFTGLGVPAISIPLPVKAGLPLGLQLTAGPGQDSLLLRTAVRVEAALRSETKA